MNYRLLIAYLVFVVFSIAVLVRAWQLQVTDHAFLDKQADLRQKRLVNINAHRGMIKDRNGEVLAVSAPVASVWVNPKRIDRKDKKWLLLAKYLGRDLGDIEKTLNARKGRSFVYLKRWVEPKTAANIMALNISGVGIKQEYKRYYPVGEVASQLIGFTNIDDHGQEGIELVYEQWLAGKQGKERVVRDGRGRILDVDAFIAQPQPGKDLVLSIDKRVQYEVVKSLSEARVKYRARAAEMVVLKVDTGEVIAMASVPSFNPNELKSRKGEKTRNRVVIDTFEPGSTMKTFAMIAALSSKKYQPSTVIDTTPGYWKIGKFKVSDHRNFGKLDLGGIIKKSSNVGISKIALDLPPEDLWQTYTKFGFGVTTASGFPGEGSGNLDYFMDWSSAKQATLAYGYGISVTGLQLANAYNIIASGGIKRPPVYLKQQKAEAGQRVISKKMAHQITQMLKTTVADDGTAPRARIAGYSVAGKTGTSKILLNGEYSKRYNAVFAGFVPADNPQFTAVVVVYDPQGKAFYGGQVAAPVFSQVMSKVLRLYNVTPDLYVRGQPPVGKVAS